MSERRNLMFIAVGRKGTGKTTIAQEIAKKIGKRICVIDTDDHPSWAELQVLEQDKISKWKSGNIRVITGDPEIALNTLNKTQANAFIICEDAAKYINSNIQQAVKNFIIDHRKRNFDVLLMFHFLADVPPYIAKQYDHMILFKTGDNMNVNQNKFANWHTIATKMERIQKSKSYNYCETIAVDE